MRARIRAAALPAVLIVASSCSNESTKPQDCPKCPEVKAAIEKPAEVAVRNTCINTADDILIHVAIDARYTGRRASETGGKSRDLWQIRCKKKSGECDGTSVSFDDAFTKGIGVLGVTTIGGGTSRREPGSGGDHQVGPAPDLHGRLRGARRSIRRVVERRSGRVEEKPAARIERRPTPGRGDRTRSSCTWSRP